MTLSEHSSRALHAGLTTFLAFLLTSALFASPLLANQFDFGHHHSEGTPAHLHSISSVLGSHVLSGVIITVITGLVLILVLAICADSRVVKLTPERSNQSRAPPAAL